MKKRITSILLCLSITASLLPATLITAQAKTGAGIEIGDYVQMGTYYGEPILWRCVAFEKISGYDSSNNPVIDSASADYSEGYLPLMLADKIITLKPFDARTSENSETGSHCRNGYRASTGSNCWSDSNIRSWLNSTEPAGDVNWHCGNAPTNECVKDGYNDYADEAGFLTNFTQDEINAIEAVSQKSILSFPETDSHIYATGSELHTYKDGIDTAVNNYGTAYAEYVTDKMFLMDVMQVNKVYKNSDILGNDYYIGKPTEQAVLYSEVKRTGMTLTTGGNWYYWLRTPAANEYGNVRYLSADGGVYDYTAYDGGTGVRPAFYLDETAEFTGGSGSSDEPYTLDKPTHTITVSAESYTGGEILVLSEAAEGDEVAILAAPDDGYELTSLTVTGDSISYSIGNGINKGENDIYTFTMPDENVLITPVFAPMTVVGTNLTYNDLDGIVKVTSDTAYENAYLITAKYTDDGALANVTSEGVNITTDKPFTKDYRADSAYNTKFMLWESLNTMTPLAAVDASDSTSASTLGNVTVSTAGTGTASKPQISLADVPNTSDRHTIGAVDVSLGEGETLDGVAEVRIKYDPNKDFDAMNLLSGYYNPEKGEWETVPYMIDEDNNEVVILTDHFSRFGLFEVEKSGTPTAFAKPISAAQLANMSSKTAAKILGLTNKPNPSLDEDTVSEVLNALDGSNNNNYTNTAGAINTLISKGGTVTEGTIGKIGTQFTIIGIAAACINVASTAYNKGVFTADTGIALTKAGIGVGVGFASASIQIAYMAASMGLMGYEMYEEKQLKSAHKDLQRLFRIYNYNQQKKLAETMGITDRTVTFNYQVIPVHWEDHWQSYGFSRYWNNQFEACYKKYYIDGLNSNTSESAAARYERFEKAIKHLIEAQAYAFSNDFQNGRFRTYNGAMAYPVNDRNSGLAADICENYNAQLMNWLSPLFKAYSRRAYNDAIKLLEKECEKLRTELNKTITLNFYEEEDSKGFAKDYYLKFASASGSEWRADFDNDGKTSLTFTALAYGELGCPEKSPFMKRKQANLWEPHRFRRNLNRETAIMCRFP